MEIFIKTVQFFLSLSLIIVLHELGHTIGKFQIPNNPRRGLLNIGPHHFQFQTIPISKQSLEKSFTNWATPLMRLKLQTILREVLYKLVNTIGQAPIPNNPQRRPL